ncbi:hypothetical protein ACS0TY_011249 [Phlomoides rotata]
MERDFEMKKEKGVAIESPNNYEEEEEEEDHRNNITQSSGLPFPTRNAFSKYDFVKVKVWLGDNSDHYYVLSRFLLSRMLTVTKANPCFVISLIDIFTDANILCI